MFVNNFIETRKIIIISILLSLVTLLFSNYAYSQCSNEDVKNRFSSLLNQEYHDSNERYDDLRDPIFGTLLKWRTLSWFSTPRSITIEGLSTGEIFKGKLVITYEWRKRVEHFIAGGGKDQQDEHGTGTGRIEVEVRCIDGELFIKDSTFQHVGGSDGRTGTIIINTIRSMNGK